MMNSIQLVLRVAMVLLMVGCSKPALNPEKDAGACEPGENRDCNCAVVGEKGRETCSEDGWGQCICDAPESDDLTDPDTADGKNTQDTATTSIGADDTADKGSVATDSEEETENTATEVPDTLSGDTETTIDSEPTSTDTDTIVLTVDSESEFGGGKDSESETSHMDTETASASDSNIPPDSETEIGTETEHMNTETDSLVDTETEPEPLDSETEDSETEDSETTTDSESDTVDTAMIESTDTVDTASDTTVSNPCNPSPCDANATCKVQDGDPLCTCNTGWTGTGLVCTDIDGCADDPCFTGVACTDVLAPGEGFTCGSCPGGLPGNGIHCGDCTLFVDEARGTTQGPGLTWDEAFSGIQPAVNEAAAMADSECLDGVEVWVAAGTYLSDSVDVGLVLRDKVAVYGGFASGEMSRSERDVLLNETVLSGRHSRLLAWTNHVVTCRATDGCGDDAVIDGFTITGGRAGGEGRDAAGGGILIEETSLTIRNCTFTANQAGDMEDASGGDGGAAAVYDGAPAFFNCVFTANRAGNGDGELTTTSSGSDGGKGGAIAFIHSGGHIEGCVFEDNLAGDGGPGFLTGTGGSGGAIYADLDASLVIVDSLFARNESGVGGESTGSRVNRGEGGDGGAVYIQRAEGSEARLERCTFTANIANGRYGEGGAMYLTGESGSVRLKDCTFQSNQTADAEVNDGELPAGGGPGGALANFGGPLLIDGCLFQENRTGTQRGGTSSTSIGPGRDGGGVYSTGDELVVVNSEFVGNQTANGLNGGSGGYGAGLFGTGEGIRIFNTKFINNITGNGGTATSASRGGDGGWGGGAHLDATGMRSAQVINCLFAQNATGRGGSRGAFDTGGYGGWGAGLSLTAENSGNRFSIINSTIADNTGGPAGLSGFSSHGGAISIYRTSATVTNAILWGNTAGIDPQIGTRDGSVDVTYSDSEEWVSGTGNFWADPLFDETYHLSILSRCVNAGVNGALPADGLDLDGDGNVEEPTPLDAGGNPRLYQTVDLGAFEVPADELEPNPGCDCVGTTECCDGCLAINEGGSCDDNWFCNGSDTCHAGACSEHTGDPCIQFDRECSDVVAQCASDCTVFVDADVIGGSRNGTSWENAFTSLSDGLIRARKGCEVWVAEGYYFLESGRYSTFRLPEGAVLYGGFSGAELAPEQRVLDTHISVLHGESGDTHTNVDNVYHVVTAASGATLDGFEITAGYGERDSMNGPEKARGAGMYAVDVTDLTIRNCTFHANSTGKYGGGVYAEDSEITFENCVFSNNGAFGGGGVSSDNGTVRFVDCTFSDNIAREGSGGGFLALGGADSVSVENSTFQNNVAVEDGGGMFCGEFDTCRVSDTLFEGNSARRGGGQFLDSWSQNTIINPMTNNTYRANNADAHGGGLFTASVLEATGCRFEGNTTVDGYGAGIYINKRDASLTDCTFDSNTAGDPDAVTGAGGGIYAIGKEDDWGILTVTNSEFRGNQAYVGGAMRNEHVTITLTNSVFDDNHGRSGGGLYNTNADLIIANTTFTGNGASAGGAIDTLGGYTHMTNGRFIGNTGSSSGGAWYIWGGLGELYNCTFYNNAAPEGSAMSTINGKNGVAIYNSILWDDLSGDTANELSGPNVRVYDSNVKDAQADDTDGNFSEEPLFVDPENGDVRLLTDSPSINAGNNDHVPSDVTDLDSDSDTDEPVPYDFDGNPRVVGAAGDDTDVIDQGAFEYQF